MQVPPPVPGRFSDVRTVVVVGSAAWLVAAAALFIAALAGVRPLDVWFTTGLTGVLLGGIGYAIFTWQRAAARRGSRTAQQGLD